MSEAIVFGRNQASVVAVEEHLRHCASSFVPPLDSRVEIGAYAKKLFDRAACFEAYVAHALVGLVGVYLNDSAEPAAFITNVSVLPSYQGQGIAVHLLAECIEQARALGFVRVELEVGRANAPAIGLYSRMGFVPHTDTADCLRMARYLQNPPADTDALPAGSQTRTAHKS